MGYERLSDLWIIRSYIHRGISRTEWGIDPSTGYFQELWDRVQASRISWPGFRRLKLSEKERAYLENCLRDLSIE